LLYFSLDFHQGLLSLAASHKATQVVVSPCFIYSSQDRASLFSRLLPLGLRRIERHCTIVPVA